MRSQHEGLSAQSVRLERVEKNQAQLFNLCTEIKDLVKFVSKRIMRDETDISHFFPIKNRQSLEVFMSKSDGMFNNRDLMTYYTAAPSIPSPIKNSFKLSGVSTRL